MQEFNDFPLRLPFALAFDLKVYFTCISFILSINLFVIYFNSNYLKELLKKTLL
jgi:hypothetical protein